ncbi:Kinesin-like protein KIN-14E, partial [Aduncisulcus paluster]
EEKKKRAEEEAERERKKAEGGEEEEEEDETLIFMKREGEKKKLEEEEDAKDKVLEGELDGIAEANKKRREERETEIRLKLSTIVEKIDTGDTDITDYDLEKLRKKIEEEKERRLEAIESEKRAQKRLEECEEALVEINKEIEAMVNDTAEKNAEMQDQKEKLSSLEAELKTLTEAAENVEAQVNDLQKEIKQLEDSKAHKLEQEEKGKEDEVSLAAQNTKKKEEIEKVKKAIGKYEKKLGAILQIQKDTEVLKTQSEKLNNNIQDSEASIPFMTSLIANEAVQRKAYYNKIQDMKGKIRVFCRCRPMNSTERSKPPEEAGNCVAFPDKFSLQVGDGTRPGGKRYTFDRTFNPDSSQDEVFEDTQLLVQSALDGYNVCIFAYGQTGSGKTYTMMGDGKSKNGITPRALETLFNTVEEGKGRFEYSVDMWMVELYNDNLRDLLVPEKEASGKKYEIKQVDGRTVVLGAKTVPIHNYDGAMKAIELGESHRKTAKTEMNDASSRSHLVMCFVIHGKDLTTKKETIGKLNLIDLAGSERAGKTKAEGERMKEAQSINLSLSALGAVISALSSGKPYVPYRQNKLTYLMMDSIGGTAKTLMFVMVSPSLYNRDETLNSLTYAQRAKKVTNSSKKSAVTSADALQKMLIKVTEKGKELGIDLEAEEEAEK